MAAFDSHSALSPSLGASWSSSSNILRSRGGDVNFGDNVRQQVYSQFDADLRKEAREEYRECLLESIEVLESVPPSGLPSSELKRIEQSFKVCWNRCNLQLCCSHSIICSILYPIWIVSNAVVALYGKLQGITLV